MEDKIKITYPDSEKVLCPASSTRTSGWSWPDI